MEAFGVAFDLDVCVCACLSTGNFLSRVPAPQCPLAGPLTVLLLAVRCSASDAVPGTGTLVYIDSKDL
jgi:hypothetical protein